VQILFGRGRSGVQREIEAAPGLLDSLEHGLELSRLTHVAREKDRRVELPREWLHVRFCLFIEVGDRDLRPQGAEGLGAPVGDRVLVGDAENQTDPAGRIWTGR